MSGKNLDEILTKVRTGAIEALQQRIEPESLGAVVRRAMALDRNKRYPSVAELQNEIAAYQAGFATRAEHATLPKQLWLAIRRHRVEASVAAVAAAALVALGAIYFIHVKEERDRANAALRSLATAAPLFAGEAKILAENGRITEAIQRLDYALTSHYTKAGSG